MQEYDVVLKTLLQGSPNSVLSQITGGAQIARWLNVELPQVQNTRVDLLGESATGELIHIELQSANDSRMPLRMAEYALRVYRLLQRFPRQIVLYVGDSEMQMKSELAGPSLICRYTIVDIRNLESEALLSSTSITDNVIAILTNLRSQRSAIYRILARLAKLTGDERSTAFAQLLILSGLRKLSTIVREEAQQMPILDSILDHEVIGPAIKQGIQQGMQQGIQQGELTILRRQMEKRFGPLPGWAEQRLAQLSTSELDDLSLRILDAHTLDELLAPNTR